MSKIQDVTKKLRLIYLPFIIVSVGFIIVYSFLHWLLILNLELFQVNEMVVEFIIPMAFPMIVIIIFLRKRIKLLKFSEKARDPHFGYVMVASIAIAVPTIISQLYLKTATGKLTQINSSKQIDLTHPTKYYQIKETYLDRRFTGVHWSTETTGKHNENMVFHGYFALPIMSQMSDTIKHDFDIWYGLEYTERISNRLSQSEKEELFQKFSESSIDKFNHENLYYYNYLDRLGTNDLHKGLLEAVKTTNRFHTTNPIILKPIKESYELRNGKKLGWVFKSYAIGSLIWLIMILIPAFHKSNLNKFLMGKPINKNEGKEIKEMMKLLIPKEGFFVTPLTIELNILIFLIMVFAGLGFITFDGRDLLNWGANFRPLVVSGDYWRLITNIFLHGGFIHLIMNMYALFFVGIFLEPALGSKRFGIFYFITGIIASISSIWWHESTVSVGASGAIFGMYGIFLALLLTKFFPTSFKKAFLLSTAIFIGYNLIIGLSGGIDNAAHIGGLLSGVTVGFSIYPLLKQEASQ